MNTEDFYIIDKIPFSLNKKKLMERLHIRDQSPEKKEFSALSENAEKTAVPKVLFREFFIDFKDENSITVENIKFQSRILSEKTGKIKRIFPFIATCGTEIDNLEKKSEDFLETYWLDQIKEEILKYAFNFLSEYLLEKYHLKKTVSMTPGSGNLDVWPIQEQKKIFALMYGQNKTIGVNLTDEFLMIPNKSVSGVIFQSEKDFVTCRYCSRKNCPERKANEK